MFLKKDFKLVWFWGICDPGLTRYVPLVQFTVVSFRSDGSLIFHCSVSSGWIWICLRKDLIWHFYVTKFLWHFVEHQGLSPLCLLPPFQFILFLIDSHCSYFLQCKMFLGNLSINSSKLKFEIITLTCL